MNPSGRQDVLRLDEWITHSITELQKGFDKIKNKDIENTKVFIDGIIKIYNISLNEIVKQVFIYINCLLYFFYQK